MCIVGIRNKQDLFPEYYNVAIMKWPGDGSRLERRKEREGKKWRRANEGKKFLGSRVFRPISLSHSSSFPLFPRFSIETIEKKLLRQHFDREREREREREGGGEREREKEAVANEQLTRH